MDVPLQSNGCQEALPGCSGALTGNCIDFDGFDVVRLSSCSGFFMRQPPSAPYFTSAGFGCSPFCHVLPVGGKVSFCCLAHCLGHRRRNLVSDFVHFWEGPKCLA